MAKKSSSGSKSSSGGKTTFSVGGKSVSLSSSQVASLSPATRAALGAAVSSGKVTMSSGGSGATTSTKTSKTPVANIDMSKINTKNAAAQLKAGNITQDQYNSVVGGTGTTTSTKTSSPAVSTTKAIPTDLAAKAKAAYENAQKAGNVDQFLKTASSLYEKEGYNFADLGLGKQNTAAIQPTQPIVKPIITTAKTPVANIDMSKINTKNAAAQLKAGNITQDQYNSVVGGTGTTTDTGTQVPTEMQTSTEMQQPGEVLDVMTDGNIKTVQAPNGKNYDLETLEGGKVSFVGYDGVPKVFNSEAEAKAAIDSANPAGQDIMYSQAQRAYDKSLGGKYEGAYEGSEIDAVNEQMKYLGLMNDRDIEDIENFKNESTMIADQLRQYNEQVANNLDAVVGERFNAMNSNFQAVTDSINKLEETANSLFDVNKMIARQNQFKQLANTGILTGEQAANAASYSLQDYVMNVELERAEIAKQMQEQMTNALKEKTAMEDQILQQKGINETVKQGMMQQLNSMYANIVDKQQTYLTNANSKLDEMITNANNTNIQVDLMAKGPLIQEKANQELIGQKLQQANTNPTYRYQYVLDTITNIAPSLVGKAAALMKEYQNNGTFMKQDAQAFISELMSRMQGATGGASGVGNVNGVNTKNVTNSLGGATDVTSGQGTTQGASGGTTQVNAPATGVKNIQYNNPGYNPITGGVYTITGKIA